MWGQQGGVHRAEVSQVECAEVKSARLSTLGRGPPGELYFGEVTGLRSFRWGTLGRVQPGGVHLGEVSQAEYTGVRSVRWSMLR